MVSKSHIFVFNLCEVFSRISVVHVNVRASSYIACDFDSDLKFGPSLDLNQVLGVDFGDILVVKVSARDDIVVSLHQLVVDVNPVLSFELGDIMRVEQTESAHDYILVWNEAEGFHASVGVPIVRVVFLIEPSEHSFFRKTVRCKQYHTHHVLSQIQLRDLIILKCLEDINLFS